MPKRELERPEQIIEWLQDWGGKLESPAEMILIGSGGLLWHAFQKGVELPLPEKSMDVDPVTFDDAVAELAYDSIIGSEFELANGWHVNLMPDMVLRELPEGWRDRISGVDYGNLHVIIPSPRDLIFPKLKRNEPRDRAHADWAKEVGLIEEL
tara:strand:- start:1004 stop:1462 length:459 start_codon:yes stop_codon:yes gene_type:complete